MVLKIILVVATFSCSVSWAQQVYETVEVEHPEVTGDGNLGNIVEATVDILQEGASAFSKLSATQAEADPSDPAFMENVVSAFMPLSRTIMLARAKAEGTQVSQGDLAKLDAVGVVMPTVTGFLQSSRLLDNQSPAATGYATGELQLDTDSSRASDGMVSAAFEMLPEIGNIFREIRTDPRGANPNDPEFVQDVLVAFTPLPRKFFLAAAKADGRVIQQEELDRLSAAEAALPSIMEFMSTFTDVDSVGTSSTSLQSPGTASHTSSSAQLRPIAAPESDQGSSAVSAAASNSRVSPVAAYVLQSPKSDSTVLLRSPGFPSIAHVPYAIPAIGQYSYVTHYTR